MFAPVILAKKADLNRQTGQQRSSAPGTNDATAQKDVAPRVFVVHETPGQNAARRSAETAGPVGPQPLLSPLASGDSGLQLLSSDPSWLHRLAPMLRRLPVTYRVRLRRTADAALVSRLRRGVTDHGEFLAASEARCVASEPTSDWMEVTLNHGKSTTVRRLFSAFGVGVEEIKRIGVGPIRLGALPDNHQRTLTESERAGLAGLSS